eukprot:5106744-Pleurochrysis_carterae.AAC.1
MAGARVAALVEVQMAGATAVAPTAAAEKAAAPMVEVQMADATDLASYSAVAQMVAVCCH